MMRTAAALSLTGALVLMASGAGWAQTPPPPTSSSPEPSRAWVVVGGSYVSLLGDCATCDDAGGYRNARGLLVSGGIRVNPRMDTAAELFWVPATTAQGERVRSTFALGIAQFRPLENHGFFVKAGMGLVFVRNWVYSPDRQAEPPFTTTGLGLTYGTGWVFRRHRRVALQVFGSQYVATLGDLPLEDRTIENIVGNFWVVGAAIVIR